MKIYWDSRYVVIFFSFTLQKSLASAKESVCKTQVIYRKITRSSSGPKSGHPPKQDVRRREVNAILYVLKTGCQWCQLPKDFGRWNQVYTCFRRWRLAGIWERVLQALREEERLRVGKKPTPTIAIIDSQSVKTTLKGGTRL